jgi:hypothetical protein
MNEMYTKCGTPARAPNICPNVVWTKDFLDPSTLLDIPFKGKDTCGCNANWPQLNDSVIGPGCHAVDALRRLAPNNSQPGGERRFLEPNRLCRYVDLRAPSGGTPVDVHPACHPFEAGPGTARVFEQAARDRRVPDRLAQVLLASTMHLSGAHRLACQNENISHRPRDPPCSRSEPTEWTNGLGTLSKRRLELTEPLQCLFKLGLRVRKCSV